MSDHLPECPCNNADERGCFLISAETDRCVSCICAALRACEARVREEERALICVEQTALSELNAEYRKGVQAALDAVAALPPSPLPQSWGIWTAMHFRGDVLAAIDALRGES